MELEISSDCFSALICLATTSRAAATATSTARLRTSRHRGLLGRGDLLFGRLQAALDGTFEVRLGLLGRGAGILAGLRDDPIRLLLHLALLALVGGQKALRLLADGAGLVELALDVGRPLVEHLCRSSRERRSRAAPR